MGQMFAFVRSAPNMQTGEHAMVNMPHSGNTLNGLGTFSDFGRSKTDLPASVLQYALENACLRRALAERDAKIRHLVAATIIERRRAEAERRESERRHRQIQMQLAHANRVATMGQLTASIAHEVNHPIAATVLNAQSALRWLGRQPSDLKKVQEALTRIIDDGIRGGELLERIRSLLKKAPLRKERVEINGAIRDVVALTRGETVKHGISVRMRLADGLPLILADRVQLQQVMLNLIINAVEAMSGASEGKRELLISTEKTRSDAVLVAVRDSGPGLAPAAVERLFEPFHTTKPGGLGLGLSICRSIVEAHGGRLWASANIPGGAVFQFTVPPQQDMTL
jgi:C4-dicarboxylate-specific signal transduction histidine kinase